MRRLCFHRCLSVHKGGVCLNACWDTPRQAPPRQTPPADTPRRHPPGRHPPADTPWADTPWAVPLRRPPPAQCMVGYGQQAGGTHPTGMQFCNIEILPFVLVWSYFLIMFQAFLTLHDRILRNRKPGQQVLQNQADVTFSCQRGWAGSDCDRCNVNFGPPLRCDQCLRGWSGQNCTESAANFGPPGQCIRFVRGWAGETCSQCATNFGPVGQCDTCVIGWAGLNCDSCSHGWTGDNCSKSDTNFGPAGQCDQCLRGWAGMNCSECETNLHLLDSATIV